VIALFGSGHNRGPEGLSTTAWRQPEDAAV